MWTKIVSFAKNYTKGMAGPNGQKKKPKDRKDPRAPIVPQPKVMRPGADSRIA